MPRHLVTAHQANYLPYLGFFEKIMRSDCFVLVDDTQFVKRGAFGWIHRNRILDQNGNPMWLTVPVKTHERYEQMIKDVEIDNAKNWRRKHWRSIEFAYRKHPHYKELSKGLKDIYEKEWSHLLGLSREIICWTLEVLSIDVPILLSSEFEIEGKATDYVLDLAKKSSASHYLSGMHGRDYLEVEKFADADIGLVFQDFDCVEYTQQNGGEFVSHLSIIDPLFSVGVEKTRELLDKGKKYEIPD